MAKRAWIKIPIRKSKLRGSFKIQIVHRRNAQVEEEMVNFL
jgi:hypothetical protein